MIWQWLIQDKVRRFVHVVLLVYKLRICKELQVITSFKVIHLVLFIKTHQDPRVHVHSMIWSLQVLNITHDLSKGYPTSFSFIQGHNHAIYKLCYWSITRENYKDNRKERFIYMENLSKTHPYCYKCYERFQVLCRHQLHDIWHALINLQYSITNLHLQSSSRCSSSEIYMYQHFRPFMFQAFVIVQIIGPAYFRKIRN